MIGEVLLAKEIARTLTREGIHPQLVHEHWRGALKATAIELQRLSYQSTPNGRIVRSRTVSAANAKLFYARLDLLCHALDNKLAHVACNADKVSQEQSPALSLCAILFTQIKLTHVSWSLSQVVHEYSTPSLHHWVPSARCLVESAMRVE